MVGFLGEKKFQLTILFPTARKTRIWQSKFNFFLGESPQTPHFRLRFFCHWIDVVCAPPPFKNSWIRPCLGLLERSNLTSECTTLHSFLKNSGRGPLYPPPPPPHPPSRRANASPPLSSARHFKWPPCWHFRLARTWRKYPFSRIRTPKINPWRLPCCPPPHTLPNTFWWSCYNNQASWGNATDSCNHAYPNWHAPPSKNPGCRGAGAGGQLPPQLFVSKGWICLYPH